MIRKMRNSMILALAMVLAALVLLPASAGATSSLSFVWDTSAMQDGSGPFVPTINVNSVSGTLLRGGILAVGDTAGLGGIFVSFRFDADNGDELNIAQAGGVEIPGCLSCTNGGAEESIALPGSGNSFSAGLPGYTRNQIESSGSQAGLLGSYDVTSGQGSGLTAGGETTSITRTLGSIWFTVNPSNVATDGDDVDIVILSDGFDAVLASSGANISTTVIREGASVVPEPASVLLGLGAAAGLGLLAIRRRS